MRSFLGIAALLFVAWLLSNNRRVIPWRMIVGGVGLQFAIAGLMLKAPLFSGAFMALNRMVAAMEEATRAGTAFVFGYVGGAALPFVESVPGASFSLAFQALPLVIVIGALTALLYYWRVLPYVVRAFSWVLSKTMGIGGALGVAAAGTIFFGMAEAPLLIRPYMVQLTASELFAMMATGMSCIAGTMLMLYATVLKTVIADSVGHILTASVIHAPAALAVAAMMLPETGRPTLGREIPKSPASGSMDAVARGTWDGPAAVAQHRGHAHRVHRPGEAGQPLPGPSAPRRGPGLHPGAGPGLDHGPGGLADRRALGRSLHGGLPSGGQGRTQ